MVDLRSRAARVALVAGVLVLAGLGGLETFARWQWGLGNPPLVEASGEYGYRFTPNQDLRRFGNRVFYNGFGLRSEPMPPNPAPGTVRILCIGDSVTNGGVLTAQRETYPYLLAARLGRPQHYEVLNASAGSWGIGNMLAYLRTEGLHGSAVVIVELGTHDLWQQKSTADAVGTRDMPDRKPALALQELVFRYGPRFLPRLAAPAEAPGPPPPENLERNLRDLQGLIATVRERGARPAVMLVPEPGELDAVPPHVAAAERELRQTLARLGVAYRWLLDDFRAARDAGAEPGRKHGLMYRWLLEHFGAEGDGGAEPLFRDGVHPTPAGNAVMAQAAAQLVERIERGGR